MRRGHVAIGFVVALVGCANDFDAFAVSDDAASTGGASGGGTSTGGTGGTSTGGAAGASTGGAAGSGAGGLAGSTASGGAAGTGVPDCTTSQKPCGGECVSRDDPATGCGSDSCAPCSTAHLAAHCEAGACVVGTTCEANFRNCDSDPATCEVDTLTDPRNCGTCGYRCVLAHATPGCDATGCVIQACEAGFGDCDARTSTGCEEALNTTLRCGTCSNDCTRLGANYVCKNGTCAPP